MAYNIMKMPGGQWILNDKGEVMLKDTGNE